MIEMECSNPNCKNVVMVYPYELKQTPNHFCCDSCFRSFMKNRPQKKRGSDYILKQTYCEIVLTNSNIKPKIDIDKIDVCKQYTWSLGQNNYIVAYTLGKKVMLHRIIVGENNIPQKMVIDHVNGDVTDNRMDNLRVCSIKENSRNLKLSKNNTSGYNGISFNKKKQKWHAYIRVNYKRKNLGIYADINDAIKARKQAELEYFGFLMEDKETIKSRDELNNSQGA